jgi:hypothetical protein
MTRIARDGMQKSAQRTYIHTRVRVVLQIAFLYANCGVVSLWCCITGFFLGNAVAQPQI